MKFNYFVKNLEAGNILEKFIISAVSSILIIRFCLSLTNYPQIGGGNIHIAHMLFGGMLMTIALFLMIIFLNREIRSFGAIIGGVGFGTFIDELGKFITKDNNYFFQPTIAIIYIIFILIFFIYKYFNNPINISNKEYIINVIELIKEIILNDYEHSEKAKAKEFLKKSNLKNNTIRLLKKIIYEKNIIPDKINIITLLKTKISKIYLKVINLKLFKIIIIIFFILYSLFQLIISFNNIKINSSFSNNGLFISYTSSILFILIGIYFIIKNKRIKAYKNFKLSVLISIFFTQFFLFFEKQLNAIILFIFNLIILNIIQNMIKNSKKDI